MKSGPIRAARTARKAKHNNREQNELGVHHKDSFRKEMDLWLEDEREQGEWLGLGSIRSWVKRAKREIEQSLGRETVEPILNSTDINREVLGTDE